MGFETEAKSQDSTTVIYSQYVYPSADDSIVID